MAMGWRLSTGSMGLKTMQIPFKHPGQSMCATYVHCTNKGWLVLTHISITIKGTQGSWSIFDPSNHSSTSSAPKFSLHVMHNFNFLCNSHWNQNIRENIVPSPNLRPWLFLPEEKSDDSRICFVDFVFRAMGDFVWILLLNFQFL